MYEQFEDEGLNALNESLRATRVLSDEYRRDITSMALQAVGEAHARGVEKASKDTEIEVRLLVESRDHWRVLAERLAKLDRRGGVESRREARVNDVIHCRRQGETGSKRICGRRATDLTSYMDLPRA